MSGSAALSAARKRRASSSPMVGGGVMNTAPSSQAGSGSYYGGGSSSKQSLQGIMNQTPYAATPPAFTMPKESAPNVPINIYENIELIKHQLVERTKLIQTQGSSIPPDKLRILQKQNEIQTQILKQKMMIAQQMGNIEQQRLVDAAAQRSSKNVPQPFSSNEPEFIYEKGIPRKNPKYNKKPEEPIKPLDAPISNMTNFSQMSQHPVAQVATSQINQQQPSRMLSPFVSMITDTGVIPPPVVILKSHDATLAEHHSVIQDMMEQLDYLHSTIKSDRIESLHEDPAQQARTEETGDDGEGEEQEAPELLMEVVMNDLTNSREFVEAIVDKIVNETNLAEVIMKIEPVIKENQELRALIHSQQQMMNEMNTILFRLLNQQQQQSIESTSNPPATSDCQESESLVVYQDEGLTGDGLYHAEMTEIVLTPSAVEEPEEEPEEEPAEEPEEEPEEEPAAQEPAAQEPAAQEPSNDEYSEMPHFPEPISLVVSEL